MCHVVLLGGSMILAPHIVLSALLRTVTYDMPVALVTWVFPGWTDSTGYDGIVLRPSSVRQL